MSINKIKEATTTIKNFPYEPTKSINLLLTSVEEHADLLKSAEVEMKDEQIQALAYFLIIKYQIV